MPINVSLFTMPLIGMDVSEKLHCQWISENLKPGLYKAVGRETSKSLNSASYLLVGRGIEGVFSGPWPHTLALAQPSALVYFRSFDITHFRNVNSL